MQFNSAALFLVLANLSWMMGMTKSHIPYNPAGQPELIKLGRSAGPRARVGA